MNVFARPSCSWFGKNLTCTWGFKLLSTSTRHFTQRLVAHVTSWTRLCSFSWNFMHLGFRGRNKIKSHFLCFSVCCPVSIKWWIKWCLVPLNPFLITVLTYEKIKHWIKDQPWRTKDQIWKLYVFLLLILIEWHASIIKKSTWSLMEMWKYTDDIQILEI